MNRFALVLLLISAWFQGSSQYTLKLIVTKVPKPTVNVAVRASEPLYVAGNFNSWNPKSEDYRLKPLGSRQQVVLKDIPAGVYAFKFTRGDWTKVETTADGRDIADRVVEVKGDMTEEIVIEGWKDDYPDKPKPYTASPQVKLLDSSFYIPQLNRNRRVWIYLPKGYATSKASYPVLYMHDGQNLFNEQTAPFGEWGVDETLDSLQQQTGKSMIVVGIDNGGDKRMTEYNPYDHKEFGKGEGNQYVDFLVQTLKPYIDAKFRTRKDVANTFIAGSSMGGLISLYAVIKYPDVFGAAGVFSPAFWVTPQMYTDVEKANWANKNPRFYFYAGDKESTSMVADMRRMVALVQKKPNVHTAEFVSPLGQHNEPTWRKQFPAFYRWLVGSNP